MILAIPEPEAPAGGTATATPHPERLARRCRRASTKPAALPRFGRLPAGGHPLVLMLHLSAARSVVRVARQPTGVGACRSGGAPGAEAARPVGGACGPLAGRLDEGTPRSSLKLYFELLDTVMAAATADRIIPSNPCDGVKLAQVLRGLS
ncbi:MAG TPA: hypothetical protein VIL44_07845, partial [Micromonospora sp.]